ncbi:MAG: hypothetical protein H6719_12470 [Sandaracinaceae bacterium]|nr:hypothetical protein [Sandaracinaceae bacterium]
MSEENEPEKPVSEYDRMSLNSLRRELDVQKAKTEQARDEAHARIREGSEKKTPWGKIIGGVVVGLVVVGGGIWLLRSSVLPIEDWSFPEFVEPDYDAGPEPELTQYPTLARPDAGTDAGRRHAAPRHRQPTDQDDRPAVQRQLDFGDTSDPLEGLPQ